MHTRVLATSKVKIGGCMKNFIRTIITLSFITVSAAAQTTTSAGQTANPAVTDNTTKQVDVSSVGKNSFTRKQARSRITKAGYTHVEKLMKSQDGLWQANAVRNGESVHVALDYKGNIATQ